MIHPRLLEIADAAIRAHIPVCVRILDFQNHGLATGTLDSLQKAGFKDGDMFLAVDGFYKNGSVYLIHNDHRGITEIFGRYDRLDFIGDENTDVGKILPYLNHTEYLRYKDRGYELDQRWVPLLIQHGLVRAKTQTIYEAV